MGTKRGSGVKRNCAECGNAFTKQGGRTTCSSVCRDVRASRIASARTPRTCVVCKTTLDAQRGRSKYCANPLCLSMRQTKTTEYRRFDQRKYWGVTGPEARFHPLSTHGWVLEHRMIVWDVYGPGPHNCRWCGRQVVWRTKNLSIRLLVDHLDDDGRNNDVSNLVISCITCNNERAVVNKWLRAGYSLEYVPSLASSEEEHPPLKRGVEIS